MFEYKKKLFKYSYLNSLHISIPAIKSKSWLGFYTYLLIVESEKF